jgi:hypothetical protein
MRCATGTVVAHPVPEPGAHISTDYAGGGRIGRMQTWDGRSARRALREYRDRLLDAALAIGGRPAALRPARLETPPAR